MEMENEDLFHKKMCGFKINRNKN